MSVLDNQMEIGLARFHVKNRLRGVRITESNVCDLYRLSYDSLYEFDLSSSSKAKVVSYVMLALVVNDKDLSRAVSLSIQIESLSGSSSCCVIC